MNITLSISQFSNSKADIKFSIAFFSLNYVSKFQFFVRFFNSLSFIIICIFYKYSVLSYSINVKSFYFNLLQLYNLILYFITIDENIIKDDWAWKYNNKNIDEIIYWQCFSVSLRISLILLFLDAFCDFIVCKRKKGKEYF